MPEGISFDEACYLIGFTPGVVPEAGEARAAALEVLTQLNWEYTFVKFIADPETGEVSVSYAFSTENGMGYDAFAAMVYVVLGTVQENIDILADM